MPGGAKVQTGSAEHNLLVSWVAQGAPWANEQQPKLVPVKLVPEEQVLQKGESQQLLLKAVFSDGAEGRHPLGGLPIVRRQSGRRGGERESQGGGLR